MCFFEVQAQGATETHNHSNYSNNYVNSIAKKGEKKNHQRGCFHNLSHRMSNPHGPSSVQSVTSDTSPHMALEIKSETSRHVAQENQNQNYESETSMRARSFHKMSQSGLRILPPHSKPNSEEKYVHRTDISESDEEDENLLSAREQLSPIDAAEENPNHNQTTMELRDRLTLHRAALNGNWQDAEDLLKKKPLYAAALFGHRDKVVDLLSETSFAELTTEEKGGILVATITHDMYDIALKILEKDATLATANNRELALKELARKPSKIGSGSQLSLWKRCLSNWFKGNKVETLVHQLVRKLSDDVRLFEDNRIDVMSLLTIAAKVGNDEFITILISTYPDITRKIDERNRSLFHIAVINRQERVLNLIHEVHEDVTRKELILIKYDVKENENILHLAGYMPPPSRLNIVSGAALQMQRELLWFEEVKMIVLPSLLMTKNSKNQTPWDLFTTQHENLRRDGEKWMKDTANNCMLVATLITTVVFAAAFTVPGGSHQETGIAIFHKAKWFRVFFISDAIALVSSSSSILMFLSILTSRFAEMDFLWSLPLKLVFGLTTLFISIVGMLVAFSATCFLVFKSEMAWFPIVIITLAVVAIILFLWLHLPLCVDIIRSTFFSRSLFRPRKKKLF